MFYTWNDKKDANYKKTTGFVQSFGIFIFLLKPIILPKVIFVNRAKASIRY